MLEKDKNIRPLIYSGGGLGCNSILEAIKNLVIYDALAALNRGFDAALESLTILQQGGVISADYVQQQREIAEGVRAGMNSTNQQTRNPRSRR